MTYIGPERRKGEDRREQQDYPHPNRRQGEPRRQEALAGVVVGLSAEDMAELASVWARVERARAEAAPQPDRLEVATGDTRR